ncbi:8-amino-7-oxononanoate synthase [Fusarium mundagurra]|uniref:8-amino-7-oxononanoate synthase n=1 Tax=Fusarium mundagurra TaxID=1567541 RepID=A0A8H5Y762_9HYPO|nr:8-amino-7-oxononanoate synthase [Fusarium mundagurra]
MPLAVFCLLSSLQSNRSSRSKNNNNNNNNNQMPARGPSRRLAEPTAEDRVSAAGSALDEAKLARDLALEELARAKEALQRAVYRQNAERTALIALRRNLGGWGRT